MNPFRKRREARKRREMERRKARREALSSTAREPAPSTSSRVAKDEPAKRAPRPPQRDRRGETPVAKRVTALLASVRTAFVGGARATGRRASAAQPFVAKVGSVVGRVLRLAAIAVFRVGAIVERLVRRSIGGGAAVTSAVVTRLSKFLTPERAVFGVTVAAAGCLIVSQFIDYRGVEIDQAAYTEVADIVRAPQRDVQTAGQAHDYLLIPIALAAVALGALALRTRRWQLGRLVSLAGLMALAIILLVDRPNGLDEGDLAIRYNDAQAVLRDGFYAELVAASALIFCGLLLSLHLRTERRPARRRRRERRRRTRSGKAPSLARSGT